MKINISLFKKKKRKIMINIIIYVGYNGSHLNSTCKIIIIINNIFTCLIYHYFMIIYNYLSKYYIKKKHSIIEFVI